MEAIVAIALAIAGGLFALSRSDMAAYKRLAKAMDYPTLAFASGGIGIMLGSILFWQDYTPDQILHIGGAVAGGTMALVCALAFFEWLGSDKGD